MSLKASNNRSVVNLGDRPLKITACARYFTFEPYEVKLLPTATAANVAVGLSRSAHGPLEFFDPDKHYAKVREYRQKQLVDRVELMPGLTQRMDPDTLTTMMSLDKRTFPKPSRESLKRANNQVLASYLILFRMPAIDPETGKELSKPAMLETLFNFLGYPLADPEKVPLPKPGVTPRALVEVFGDREGSPDPEGKADDDDEDE